MPTTRYHLTHLSDIPPIPCPCGEARRAFTEDPDQTASTHLVTISINARTHYHKHHTEIYYILEGHGEIELDGNRHHLKPGDSILIKPHCRHRAIGRLTILNTSIPTFDPEDEWFD